MKELHSQEVRKLAPENDPLKIGMGWTVEDLEKPQILVESTFGDSHPGSAHLDLFVERYFCCYAACMCYQCFADAHTLIFRKNGYGPHA